MNLWKAQNKNTNGQAVYPRLAFGISPLQNMLLFLISFLHAFEITGSFGSDIHKIMSEAGIEISKYIDINTEFNIKLDNSDGHNNTHQMDMDGKPISNPQVAKLTKVMTNRGITTQYHAKSMNSTLKFEEPDLVLYSKAPLTVNIVIQILFNAFGIITAPFVSDFNQQMPSDIESTYPDFEAVQDQFIRHPIPFVDNHFMSPPTIFQSLLKCGDMFLDSYFEQFKSLCIDDIKIFQIQGMPPAIQNDLIQKILQDKKFKLRVEGNCPLKYDTNGLSHELNDPKMCSNNEQLEDLPTISSKLKKESIMATNPVNLSRSDPVLDMLCELGYAVNNKSCSPLSLSIGKQINCQKWMDLDIKIMKTSESGSTTSIIIVLFAFLALAVLFGFIYLRKIKRQKSIKKILL